MDPSPPYLPCSLLVDRGDLMLFVEEPAPPLGLARQVLLSLQETYDLMVGEAAATAL